MREFYNNLKYNAMEIMRFKVIKKVFQNEKNRSLKGRAMMFSIVINITISLMVLVAVLMHLKKTTARILFRFFTLQSNVFCALTCLVFACFEIAGVVPEAVYILKFTGTVAVMVTFLTVMLFLGPVVHSYKEMFVGPDLFLHLICPLAALVAYIFPDRTRMSPWAVFFGVLPVILYGILYLKKVVFTKGENAWEDFYGFNKDGKWKISFVLMIAATALLSFLMYTLGGCVS